MGKLIVAAARFLLLCAVLLLFLTILLPDKAFAQQPTPAMKPTQSSPETLIPVLGNAHQAITFLTQMITLAMQNGGAGQEAQLEALKQQIETLPKPKRGDRKAARLQNNKGLEASKKGQHEQALQFFLTAYQLDPGDVEVVNNVGMAYIMTGNLPEAARYLGGALSLAPNRAAAWGNLAEVFARDSRPEEAVAAYALTYRYSKNKDATRRFIEAQAANDYNPQIVQASKVALALPLISGRTESGEDENRRLAEEGQGRQKEQPATPPVAERVSTPEPMDNSPIILALDGMDWGATCASTPNCVTATAGKLAVIAAVSPGAALDELGKFIELSGGRQEGYLAKELSSQGYGSTCDFRAKGPFCDIYTVPWGGGIANNDQYLNYISLIQGTIRVLAKKFPTHPLVVVAHSWGSVVAFHVLEDLLADELPHPIELLVTLGSPLQTDSEFVRTLVNMLPGEIPGKNYVLASKLSRPKSVKYWINFYVAGSGLQSDFFATSNTAANENIMLPPASISFPQTHADYFNNLANAHAMARAIATILYSSAERPQQEAASQQAIHSAASRCTGDQIEKMITAGFSKEEIMRLCETTTESPAKGTLSREEVVAPVPETQSQIMTLDELSAFAAKQAKAYKVTINCMDPNQGLECKKLLRSPGDHLGQVVLIRGELAEYDPMFRQVNVGLRWQVFSPKRDASERVSLNLPGLTPQSPIHKLHADDLLIVGSVEPGYRGPTGYKATADINIYLICGIISDAPSKRAEVRCDRVKKP